MVIPSGQLGAIAVVQGDGDVQGTVKFYPVPSGTLVAAEFMGLPDTEACSLNLHSGTFPPIQSQNGRAFLAAEACGIRAWELLGQTVDLQVQGYSIGRGQVCEP